MTYNTLQHGELTSPRCHFSSTWIPHAQALSYHVLRLKERQIHIGRTDLRVKRPDTSLSSIAHRAGIEINHVHVFAIGRLVVVQKGVEVAYERLQLYSDFNGGILVLGIGSRLWVEVSYERWSHMEVGLHITECAKFRDTAALSTKFRGTLNGFLLNTLKTLFRLSTTLLDLYKSILSVALKFVSVLSS